MKKFFISFVLVVMSVFAGQSAHAETFTETYVVEGTHVEVFSPGALSNMQTIVKQYGISMDQVIYEDGLQYATSSEDEYLIKEQSLRQWWDTAAETGTRSRLHIVVKSTPTKEFMAQIASIPADTIVEVCPDCLSQKELSDLNVQLFWKIHAKFPSTTFFWSMGPSKRGNVIEVDLNEKHVNETVGELPVVEMMSEAEITALTEFVLSQLPQNVDVVIRDWNPSVIRQDAGLASGDAPVATCTGEAIDARLNQLGVISSGTCEGIKSVFQAENTGVAIPAQQTLTNPGVAHKIITVPKLLIREDTPTVQGTSIATTTFSTSSGSLVPSNSTLPDLLRLLGVVSSFALVGFLFAQAYRRRAKASVI